MTKPIPASYPPAGRLTFQSGATIYWAICWGGASYTGSTTGNATNDDDGTFVGDAVLESLAADILRLAGESFSGLRLHPSLRHFLRLGDLFWRP